MMTSVLFLIPEKQNMSESLLLSSQTPLLHSFPPLFSVEHILATNLPNGLSAINSWWRTHRFWEAETMPPSTAA